MSTPSRARAALRWLAAPLLTVIDRRIAYRMHEDRERAARMERELTGIRDYVQLMAGALTTDGSGTTLAEVTPPAAPAPALTTIAVPDTVEDHASYLDRIACPVCRARVHVVPELVTEDGRVKRGYVPCPDCGVVVAQVCDFHVNFHERSGAIPERVPERRVIPTPGELRIPADDPRLRLVGNWTPWDDHLMTSRGALGDAVEYRGRFTDALVRLVTNDRSGIVDFFVDGRRVGTADLYSEHWFVMPFTISSNLAFEEHVLRLQPRGTRNDRSGGTEILVAEVVLAGPLADATFPAPEAMIFGNPYMYIFERAIDAVPEDELILEVGGGERRRLRPGFVNLEYLPLEFANVYGDVHQLPFLDDTFSLVLAQAVFEHVANPFVAAAELIRVARPGGLIVADVAFMQPLHAAPHHYFNMTPWGIQEIFKSCQIVEVDYYDGIAHTVEWMLRSVGAQAVVSEAEFASVIDGIRAMEAKLSHANLRPAASGYYCIARKPVAPAVALNGAAAATGRP